MRLRRLLAALSWLPAAHRPRTCAEFEDLVQLCTVLARIFRFRTHGDLRTHAWAERHGPCMRRWLAECRQPGWALAARQCDAQAFEAACADAADFLGTLTEALQDRHGVSDDDALALAMRWAAGIGLRRLLDLSRQWHVQAFETPGQTGTGVATWPAILPEPLRFEDVTIVELASSAQLAMEGRLMRHCVATYDEACYRGHSAIVSLRATSGAVRSTAELRLVEADVLRVVVEQHRSAYNRAPDSACVRVLGALVRRLNGDDAEPALRARVQFQRRHREQVRREEHMRRGHAHELALRLASTTGFMLQVSPKTRMCSNAGDA